MNYTLLLLREFMKWWFYLRKGVLSRPLSRRYASVFTSLQVEGTLFWLRRLRNLDRAMFMKGWITELGRVSTGQPIAVSAPFSVGTDMQCGPTF